MADSIGSAWESLGNSLSSAYEAWSDAEGFFDEFDARRWIEQELAQQESLLQMQSALVDAQIAYMNAKTDALRDQEDIIQIDGAGLQPHLEAFMWEILAAIQTRVNEEGLDMLLGVDDVTL